MSLHQTVWRHGGTQVELIQPFFDYVKRKIEEVGTDFLPTFVLVLFSLFFLSFFFLFFLFVSSPLFTVILNLPRHHYPLISPLPAPLPLSRGLVSESSCVHARTLARACVFNVHAFVLYTLHAYKYVYAYVLRTTNVGIVHLHTLPPAPSLPLRPPSPRAPPSSPRPPVASHYNRFAYKYTGHLDGWYVY